MLRRNFEIGARITFFNQPCLDVKKARPQGRAGRLNQVALSPMVVGTATLPPNPNSGCINDGHLDIHPGLAWLGQQGCAGETLSSATDHLRS
jgi:hypothetical protein